MDAFRWSDGRSHAVEFQAQENGFLQPAVDALREFHKQASSWGTDKVHFRQAELHIQINGNWRQLKHDGALVVFPGSAENTPEAIADFYTRLEPELLFKQGMIWDRVRRVYEQEGRLSQFINGFSDTLKSIVEEEE